MKIGYLGVGIIAGCMIEGFCGLGEQHHFYLSPRNVQKTTELAAEYSNITVCESNQHVVDASDVVVISMMASNIVDVLKGLKFRPDQQIINVVATTPPEDVREAVGTVGSFSQIIPLPSIKHRTGPIAAYPESDFLNKLLSPLGTVVFANTLDDIRTMQAITGLIATFYDVMHNLAIFCESEGLAHDRATSFMSAFFASLAENIKDADFDELAAEMTPGGLNEMAVTALQERGATKAWADVLVPVIERIKKA